VVRSTPRLVWGPEWKLAALREKSEDSKRLNIAYIERLNLFLRWRCSYLHRKTSGRVRNPYRLAMMVDLLRCHYNYIKPHLRLRFGTVTRTPAMQAKIFSKALSWRAVFAWPPRPPTPAQQIASELDGYHTSQHNFSGRLGAGDDLDSARLVADTCQLPARYSPLPFARKLESTPPRSDPRLADSSAPHRSDPLHAVPLHSPTGSRRRPTSAHGRRFRNANVGGSSPPRSCAAC
jgi:hypothetical protein